MRVPGEAFGFNEAEVAADGSRSYSMIQDGFVGVDVDAPAVELELAAHGFEPTGRAAST